MCQVLIIDTWNEYKCIRSYNKKLLQKSSYTQQKKLSLLTRDCNLHIFTANETITSLGQNELFQEESYLLKAGLYFSIQPDKIWKSEIFTTLEKVHCSFLNNLKSDETKIQIKAHSSYLTNFCFYNYKPSPRIPHQHHVLWHFRKNKDIVITKPDKENGVVIICRKLYNNAVEEIISDTFKFGKINETWSVTTTFLSKLKQKKFLTKLNMLNCILLVMLLLVSVVLLKCANSSLLIHFLNFVWLFHL